MSFSPKVKKSGDGAFKLKDAGANNIVIPFCMGDLQLSYMGSGKESVIVYDRDTASHERAGKDVLVEGSFSCKLTEFISSSGAALSATPHEAITKTGNASGWAAVDTSTMESYNLDGEWTIAAAGAPKAEVITVTKMHNIRIQSQEGDPENKLSFTFRAFCTRPTIAKAT